jgi:hypothetical protein
MTVVNKQGLNIWYVEDKDMLLCCGIVNHSRHLNHFLKNRNNTMLGHLT